MGEVEKVLEVSRMLLATGPASGSVKGADSMKQDLYKGEASIDSDLVVILAALLCALICALGLNSVLRCALRCRRRRRELEDDVASRLANRGLKKAALKALPIIIYGSSPCKVTGFGSDCPICLAEFQEGESLRVLPKCNHGFHVECIDKWLASHSSCPTCRHCLKKKPSPAPAPPPAPATCCASAVPGTCRAPPVTPSDAVQIIVEVPASDRSTQAEPDGAPPAVSGLGQESPSEHRADADVS